MKILYKAVAGTRGIFGSREYRHQVHIGIIEDDFREWLSQFENVNREESTWEEIRK